MLTIYIYVYIYIYIYIYIYTYIYTHTRTHILAFCNFSMDVCISASRSSSNTVHVFDLSLLCTTGTFLYKPMYNLHEGLSDSLCLRKAHGRNEFVLGVSKEGVFFERMAAAGSSCSIVLNEKSTNSFNMLFLSIWKQHVLFCVCVCVCVCVCARARTEWTWRRPPKKAAGRRVIISGNSPSHVQSSGTQIICMDQMSTTTQNCEPVYSVHAQTLKQKMIPTCCTGHLYD
jgi:hypothetical protein